MFAVNNVLDIEKDKEGGKSINAKTISLLVTPKQASIVMLASQMGVVNLVMRSPDTEEKSENAEARPSELFGAVAKSPKDNDEPAAPPPKLKEPVCGSRPVAGRKNEVTPDVDHTSAQAERGRRGEVRGESPPAIRRTRRVETVDGAVGTVRRAAGVEGRPGAVRAADPKRPRMLVPSDFAPLAPQQTQGEM